jgi:hypothetical protein
MKRTVSDTQACLDACHACAVACERWTAAALAVRGRIAAASSVAAALDCAQYARLLAGFLGRGSPHVALLCEDGAELGQDALARFESDPDERAQACAHACREWVHACLRLTQVPLSEAAMVAAGLPPSALRPD